EVLVALGPVAEEGELVADRGLGLGGGGLEREGRGGVHGSASLPAYALRRVLEENALGRELLADGVGAGEVARLLGRRALVHQGLDAGVVVSRGAAREPGRRGLLQEAECAPAGTQVRCARGEAGEGVVGGLARGHVGA